MVFLCKMYYESMINKKNYVLLGLLMHWLILEALPDSFLVAGEV